MHEFRGFATSWLACVGSGQLTPITNSMVESALVGRCILSIRKELLELFTCALLSVLPVGFSYGLVPVCFNCGHF